MDKYVGKRLEGRYEILDIIGVGGMAVVYKAYDNIEDKIVAVKILKEEYTANEEFIRRFKNESKAIALMSHPNIVNVYDVSFGVNIQFIVMEYIDGITLKELIEKQGSLRWKDALSFAVQILRGLQHAHDKGIVHRDVKPQNIMVLSDGTIKVTDFGIARFARSEQKTITDKAIGSVHYISPEQARGENTDEQADIYSVGVILYEMLTGQLPFQAENAVSVAIMQLQKAPEMPTKINGSIPLGLEQITMHAMEKSTARRYKSAAEMLLDLENFKKDPQKVFEYEYFVDNSPTKYVELPEESAATEEVSEKTKTITRKDSFIPIFAGIATAFVTALIILTAIFLPQLIGGTGAEIKCPDFVGQNWEEIKNDKNYIYNFDITEEWGSSDKEKGVVYNQSIAAGKSIKDGAKIKIYISSGPKTKTVPDVSQYKMNLALTKLKSEGFDTAVEEEYSDEIEEGVVIRTVPEAGATAAENSTVSVYVSLGKQTIPVDIPNCVGMNKNDAIKLLESKGLVVKNISTANNSGKNYSEGTVISQSPAYEPGKTVGKGSKVDLVVSSGIYDTSITVSLPADFIETTGTVSIWSEGTCLKETATDTLKPSSKYTISFLSKSASLENCIIKVKYNGLDHNYLKISVNCVNSTYKILNEDLLE